MNKKKALGRDLSALLGDLEEAGDAVGGAQPGGEAVAQIDIHKINPARHQARRVFAQAKIKELADSIRASGLMQPIIVRPKAGTKDEYELIAGERRWQAARAAGLEQVPSLVRRMDDRQAAVLGLLENVQREDLGAYEQALALKELLTKYAYTQQALADRLGMSRASIANLLRLLNLTEPAATMLRQHQLDAGHAKVLLALPPKEQAAAAKEAVAKGLNVRQVEMLTKRLLAGRGGRPQPKADADIIALQEELSDKLGVAVVFSHRKDGGGKMMINYTNLDELDRIFKTLKLRGNAKAKSDS